MSILPAQSIISFVQIWLGAVKYRVMRDFQLHYNFPLEILFAVDKPMALLDDIIFLRLN